MYSIFRYEEKVQIEDRLVAKFTRFRERSCVANSQGFAWILITEIWSLEEKRSLEKDPQVSKVVQMGMSSW